MARSFGQIYAGIWRDDDFQALASDAQLVYIMLSTQADISSCGLLSMTLGRWAKYTTGMTKERLSDALSELEQARFIVVDDDTEEVLVRTFVKWDGGANNGKRRPAILAAAHAIASPMLKGIVGAELTKLDVQHDLPDSPSDSPSHEAPHSPRVQVTERNHSGLNPEPVNLNPEPATVALASAEPTAQTLTGEWIDRCAKRPPTSVVGQVSKHIRLMLDDGIDPDDIRRGTAAWMSKGLHPSTLPSVVNEVMNTTASVPKTRDKFAEGIALAKQMLDKQDRQDGLPLQIGAAR